MNDEISRDRAYIVKLKRSLDAFEQTEGRLFTVREGTNILRCIGEISGTRNMLRLQIIVRPDDTEYVDSAEAVCFDFEELERRYFRAVALNERRKAVKQMESQCWRDKDGETTI